MQVYKDQITSNYSVIIFNLLIYSFLLIQTTSKLFYMIKSITTTQTFTFFYIVCLSDIFSFLFLFHPVPHALSGIIIWTMCVYVCVCFVWLYIHFWDSHIIVGNFIQISPTFSYVPVAHLLPYFILYPFISCLSLSIYLAIIPFILKKKLDQNIWIFSSFLFNTI